MEFHPHLSEFYYEAQNYFPDSASDDDYPESSRRLDDDDEEDESMTTDLKKYHLVETCIP